MDLNTDGKTDLLVIFKQDLAHVPSQSNVKSFAVHPDML